MRKNVRRIAVSVQERLRSPEVRCTIKCKMGNRFSPQTRSHTTWHPLAPSHPLPLQLPQYRCRRNRLGSFRVWRANRSCATVAYQGIVCRARPLTASVCLARILQKSGSRTTLRANPAAETRFDPENCTGTARDRIPFARAPCKPAETMRQVDIDSPVEPATFAASPIATRHRWPKAPSSVCRS